MTLIYFEVKGRVVHQLIFRKYDNDAHPSNTIQDIRQNHWTMKLMNILVTVTYIFFGQRWHHTDSLSQSMMFIH